MQKSNDYPQISIIMPTFNDDDALEESINSVLSQTFKDYELIIVDDCSETSPKQRIAEFGDTRIKFIQLSTNCGAALARNKGVDVARGRYIAFIDSDDTWDHQKLEKQLARFHETGAAFLYTKFYLIDDQGRRFSCSEPMPAIATYGRLLRHCFIRTSSLIYDTDRTKGKLHFPPLRKRQDYGLFLALLKISNGVLLDEYLCSYRIRAGSVSSNKWANISYQWAIYRETERFSLLMSIYYMSHWFVRAGFVVCRRKIMAKSRFAPLAGRKYESV